MKGLKTLSILTISLGILFGCGGSDDQPLPGPGGPIPAPVGPGTVPGTNCARVGGGTALSNQPFVGTLVPLQNRTYQWSPQVSSLTLSASVLNNLSYSYQSSVIASGAITLTELSSLLGQTNQSVAPTACVASPTGNQNNNTGYFSNGQVRNLILNGTITVPYYSPFSWGGYPSGTSPTVGQQSIQVIVGSTCVTSLVPAYSNTSAGRIRGCITVRIGNQTYNYQSQ